MPLDIIVGAQWGDEGKGRTVDLLARRARLVARYSGGDNAGHTVTVGEKIFKLHLLPSGLIHEHTVGVLGNGMVINPATLLQEMEMVRAEGVVITPERLILSAGAHIITPAHLALDAAQEKQRGEGQIGTTLRGIGPAYVDKIARRGLRAGDMLDEEEFTEIIQAHVEETNERLKMYGGEPLDPAAVAAEYVTYARQLQPYIGDASGEIYRALQAGEYVLAEGAQGTLLDIDHGTYPFVTSSSPTAPGALAGLGIGIPEIGSVIGVTKAFQTRVGEGGMPTELSGAIANHLRGTGDNPWDEYGTTTGRPRRVGWLDLVLLRYAVRVNGLRELALTKLDILTGIDPLKVCVAYRINGEQVSDLPLGLHGMEDCEPVYEELPGWQIDVQNARTMNDLPPEARAYIKKIEEASGLPVSWVSVGAERDQVVVC